ncbi:hypothetical protein ACOYYR_13525 [Enterococcus lactis]
MRKFQESLTIKHKQTVSRAGLSSKRGRTSKKKVSRTVTTLI